MKSTTIQLPSTATDAFLQVYVNAKNKPAAKAETRPRKLQYISKKGAVRKIAQPPTFQFLKPFYGIS